MITVPFEWDLEQEGRYDEFSYYIVMKYDRLPQETVDGTNDLDNAYYLLGEYKLGAAQHMEYWISLAKDGSPMEEQL